MGSRRFSKYSEEEFRIIYERNRAIHKPYTWKDFILSIFKKEKVMYFERFKNNHNTVSVALSLECNDEDWTEGLDDCPAIIKVDFFFEEGTNRDKIDRHKRMAGEMGLQVKGCFSDVPKEDIKKMIEYTESVNGIILDSD